MAHKKATGSKARQGGNVRGKRLGLKVSSGQSVSTGSILVRQIGSKIRAGLGVGQGRDFTLFADQDGKVGFKIKEEKKFITVTENKEARLDSPKVRQDKKVKEAKNG